MIYTDYYGDSYCIWVDEIGKVDEIIMAVLELNSENEITQTAKHVNDKID